MSKMFGLLFTVLLVLAGSSALAQPSGDQKPVQSCSSGWAFCCKGPADCIQYPGNKLGAVSFDRCWWWKPPGCWPCGHNGWYNVWKKCVDQNPKVPASDIYACTPFYWRQDACFQYSPSSWPGNASQTQPSQK